MPTMLTKESIQVLLDYTNETLEMFKNDDIDETYSTSGLLLKKDSFVDLKKQLENLLQAF
jgi:hypothetical protein